MNKISPLPRVALPSRLAPGPFTVQPVGVNSQPASWAEWPLEPRKHGQHPSEGTVQLRHASTGHLQSRRFSLAYDFFRFVR